MPSLLPWRMPAWLADVIDGRIASHRESLWVPSRIQPPIVLTDPARTRPARIGWARPSIWMITRPGLSVLAPRAVRHQARDEEAEVRPAAVDAEDRRQRRVDRGVDERADERGDEPVDLDAVRQRRDDEERQDLQDEDEDAEKHERPRCDEREQDGPDDRVEQGHQDDRDHGVADAPDLDAGQDPGGQQAARASRSRG